MTTKDKYGNTIPDIPCGWRKIDYGFVKKGDMINWGGDFINIDFIHIGKSVTWWIENSRMTQPIFIIRKILMGNVDGITFPLTEDQEKTIEEEIRKKEEKNFKKGDVLVRIDPYKVDTFNIEFYLAPWDGNLENDIHSSWRTRKATPEEVNMYKNIYVNEATPEEKKWVIKGEI